MEAAHRGDGFIFDNNRDNSHIFAPGYREPLFPAAQSICNAKSPPVSISNGNRSYSQELDNVPEVGTSSEDLTFCGIIVDKVLQQFTLLAYPDDPLSNPVYPVCEVPVPYPGQCSPELNSHSENRLNAYFAQNCCTVHHTMGDHFRTKTTSNIRKSGTVETASKLETVDNWIESLPIREVGKHQWESECYYSNFSPDWEEDEMENSLSKGYSQPTDEILYFLAKKFEAVVCKLYQLEKEPTPTEISD